MHMTPFRRALSNLQVVCALADDHYCVLCGMKEVQEKYSELQCSNGGAVDVSRLRTALALLYESCGKFQLEETADAMEALSAILQNLHARASGAPALSSDADFSNAYCGQNCPAHSAFSLQLIEQLECECGATSEPQPWDFSSFQYQVYMSDVLSNLPRSIRLLRGSLCPTIKQLNVHSTQASRLYEECPDNCTIKRSRKVIDLMSAADALVLNLVWSKFRPRGKDVVAVLAMMPESLALGEMFSDQMGVGETYEIRGFIAFGCVHYVAYFKSIDSDQWHKFDDSLITEMPSYSKVITNVLQSRLHPVGVFYEKRKAATSGLGVSEAEWEQLAQVAAKLDAQEEWESDPWKCEQCSTHNAAGRKMCEKCFKLRHGIPGWACPCCTSINSSISHFCEVCSKQRRYVCTKCFQASLYSTCIDCSRTGNCVKCRVRERTVGALCRECMAEESGREVLKKSMAEMRNYRSASTCLTCDSPLTADGKCPICGRAPNSSLEVIGTRSHYGVSLGTTDSRRACERCSNPPSVCSCYHSLNRPRTERCLFCNVIEPNHVCARAANPLRHSIASTTPIETCSKCRGSRLIGTCVCCPTSSDKSVMDVPCAKCRAIITSLKKYCQICGSEYSLRTQKCYHCLSKCTCFLCRRCYEVSGRGARPTAGAYYYR